VADHDDDFAPEELAMLRSFFRDEAHETLERLASELLRTPRAGPDAEALGDLMRATHTLKGSAGTVGVPEMVGFAHEVEDQLARLRAGKLAWSASLLDVLVETIDAMRGYIDALDDEGGRLLATGRVREQLDLLGRVSAAAPAAAPAEPVSDGAVTAPYRGGDSTRTVVAGEVGAGHDLSGVYPSSQGVLRVDPGRVDRLMDSVGELVFDRTRIERRVQHLRDLARSLEDTRRRLRDHVVQASRAAAAPGLAGALSEVEAELAERVTELSRASAALLDDADALRRTSAALQDGLTRVRMLKAGALFQQLAPPLRAIARGEGKRVRLVTGGEDTEFDKTVAERITDPLIQLLRNAVAHGIEPGEVREAAGKAPEGEVKILARQERGLVVLEVADDGAGIDPATLRQRLVVSGRWTRSRAEMATDEEVLRSIFEPGVSTREHADRLAGRGVGLDAVRESIARLGGEIRMTSTPGEGTVFTMRLPVSAAVSQALLFKVHGHVYAIPNVHVVETAYAEISAGAVPPTLTVRDDLIPLVSLHQILGGAGPGAGRSLPAVVIEFAGRRFAVTCDKIVGPREIVVKHLGPLLAPLPLYAGATISGSGKVQLILDPASLARIAHPGAKSAAPTPAPQATTGPTPVAPVARAGRALVADDSRAIREAMTQILASAGYIVDVAEDGARAWRMVRELDYQLVVTDIEMPELDGLGLIERIREDPGLNTLPVVVITSRGSGDTRESAEELGIQGFVFKPVTRRKILDALEKMRPAS
jgi:chemotaxis protein histidine kinase CheA/CheY-like chemotaxis protein